MNRKPLFESTISLLITAWENGKLTHADCEACAVGNICKGDIRWGHLFITVPATKINYRRKIRFGRIMVNTSPSYAETILREVVEPTGYTEEELARIEYAFESAIFHDYDALRHTEEGQYLGLCAVIDVLTDIHNVPDPTPSKTSLNQLAHSKGVQTIPV